MEQDELSGPYFMLTGITIAIPFQYMLTSAQYFKEVEVYNLDIKEHRILLIYILSITIASFIGFKLTKILNNSTRFETFLLYSGLCNTVLTLLYTLITDKFICGIVCILLIIFSGVAYSIMITAAYGSLSLFSEIYISIFFEGYAIGSIIVLVLKALSKIIFSSNSVLEQLIFSQLILGLIVLLMFFHTKLTSTEFYIYQLQPNLRNPENETPKFEEIFQQISNEQNLLRRLSLEDQGIQNMIYQAPSESIQLYRDFYKVFKAAPIDYILLMLVQIQTYSLYPRRFINIQLFDISVDWSVFLCLFSYGFFDAIGRYIVRFKYIQNTNLFFGVTLARFCVSLVFYYIDQFETLKIMQNGILELILIQTFGFTHGLLTAGYFLIITSQLKHTYKEPNGFLSATLINLSIFVGILFSLNTQT